MTGVIKMYDMTPIVRHDTSIELPSCMYHLKNLHTCRNEDKLAQNEVTGILRAQADVNITKKDNSTSKEMMDVILRQERLLEQLEGLQKQMQTIREQLKVSKTTTKTTTKSVATQKLNLKNLPEDLVLIACPNNPPFSILLLQRLWSKVLNISVQTFKHSTVVTLDEQAQNFNKSLETFTCDKNLPKIQVRLVWKDVAANKFELNLGTNQLIGECNFLRYLARLTNGLNYDESNYEIDAFIDLSHKIVTEIYKTERAKLLQFVTKKLGKSTFLFGENLNIADIAMYSALKQVAAPNEINVRMKNWMEKCESI